jgi:hypothetical protein
MARRGRGWTLPLGAVVLVLALVASACGDAPTQVATDGDELKVATISRATEAAGTARFAGTWRSGDEGDEDGYQSAEFSGEIDFARDRTSFEGRGVDGRRRQQRYRTRYVDGSLYTDRSGVSDPDEVFGDYDPAKPWLQERLPDVGFGMLPTSGIADVSTLFDTLEEEGIEGEELGAENVRGVPTTHYRYTWTPDPAPAQVEALQPRDDDDQANDDDPPYVFELWADADNRLRRLRSTLDISGDGMEHDAEFFDFGAPVNIEPPPPDQVTVDRTRDVTGDWVLVAEGEADDISWSVFRAPVEGGVCISVETDPPAAGADAWPKSRGKPARFCSYGGDDPEDAWWPGELTAVADPLPNGMALLYGFGDDEARRMTFHLRGGGEREVESPDGYFAVALGADELVELIVPDIPGRDVRCPLDHGDYSCEEEQQAESVVPPLDGTIDTSPAATPPPP